MGSVIQKEHECFLCHRTEGLDKHHIFGAGCRTLSEWYGYTVYLCRECHIRVHDDARLRTHLKKIAQKHFETHHGGREDFIKVFVRSYMEDEE